MENTFPVPLVILECSMFACWQIIKTNLKQVSEIFPLNQLFWWRFRFYELKPYVFLSIFIFVFSAILTFCISLFKLHISHFTFNYAGSISSISLFCLSSSYYSWCVESLLVFKNDGFILLFLFLFAASSFSILILFASILLFFYYRLPQRNESFL